MDERMDGWMKVERDRMAGWKVRSWEGLWLSTFTSEFLPA